MKKNNTIDLEIQSIINFTKNHNIETFNRLNLIFEGDLLNNTLNLIRDIQSEYSVFTGNFDSLYFIKSKEIIELQRKCSQGYLNSKINKIDRDRNINSISELEREHSKLQNIYSQSRYISIYAKSKKEVSSLKNASSFTKIIHNLFNQRKHGLSSAIYALDYLLKKQNMPAFKNKTSSDFYSIFLYCQKRQPEIKKTIEEIRNSPYIKSSLINEFKENKELLESKKKCFIKKFKEKLITGLILNNNILHFFEKNNINPTGDILNSIDIIKNNNSINLLKNDDNFFDFEDDISIKSRLNSKSPSFS